MRPVHAIMSAALSAMLWAMPAQALTLDFEFSFANDFFGVTGLITGLEDDTFGQMADSVVLETNGLGFGFGDYVNDPTALILDHSFNVVDGQIVLANFVSALVPDSLLVLRTFDDSTRIEGVPGVVGVPQGELTFTQLPPSPVPLPAGLVLMLTGAGALAGLRRMRAASSL